MANFIGGIISITLGVIVLANVFMTTVHNANTTGWTTSEVANIKDNSLISTVMGSLRLSGSNWNPLRDSFRLWSNVNQIELIKLALPEA